MLLIFRGTKLVIYFGTANINRCLYGNFVYFFIIFRGSQIYFFHICNPPITLKTTIDYIE